MKTVKERDHTTLLSKGRGLGFPEGKLTSQIVSQHEHVPSKQWNVIAKSTPFPFTTRKAACLKGCMTALDLPVVQVSQEFCPSGPCGHAHDEWTRSQMNVPSTKEGGYSVLDNVPSHPCIYLFLNCKNVLMVPSRPKCWAIFTINSYTHQFYLA